VVNEFACALVGPEGAGDAVDPVITANSHMKFNYVRYFPENPIYGTIQVFDEGCGTPLTAVETALTGVCFSDGFISQKYACGK
jgi:hypothetical protein